MGCGASQPQEDSTARPQVSAPSPQNSAGTQRGSKDAKPSAAAKPVSPAQPTSPAPPQPAKDPKAKPPSPNGTPPTPAVAVAATQPPSKAQVQAQAAAKPKAAPDILLPQPSTSGDITQRGVRLRFLQHMLDSGAVDAGLTMQEVLEQYVLPRTKAHMCCLFDLVPVESTGRPRYFVSCAASHKVGELLQLLREHFQSEGPEAEQVLLWLDVMAVNPHQGKASMVDGDMAQLASVTDKLLFCLDQQCSALRDSWCLFQAWEASMAKGPAGLLVLMPMVEASKLKESLKTLDVLKSETAAPKDKEKILEAMGGEEAAGEVGAQVKDAIVGSALHEAEHTHATDAPWAAILNKASELALADGKFMEAEIMGQQALETRRQVLGPSHPDTLRSVVNLAVCLTERGRSGEAGRHKEAEPLFREVLEAKTAALTAEHPETVNWLEKLACCIDAQGRRLDAEPLYRQVLAARTRLLGADHPDTLKCVGNLATCIKALAAEEDGASRVAMAEALYKQALEAYTRVLGPEHADTIHAFNNLAICYDDQGRRDEAEPMFFKVLEARTRLLGPDHTTTADAMYNLGGLLEAEGEYDEALRMYESARDVYCKAYGPNHSETEDARSRGVAMLELINYERSSVAARAST